MTYQLVLSITSQRVAQDIQEVFEDFVSLEYFQKYGTYCVLMSSLVAHAMLRKGYQVSVFSCYAEFSNETHLFYLGHRDHAKPGQLNGHAVCMLNSAVLIDFGIGNAKKYFSEHLPVALATELQNFNQATAILDQVTLPSQYSVSWKTDWASPAVEKEFEIQAAFVQNVLKDYYALLDARAAKSKTTQVILEKNLATLASN